MARPSKLTEVQWEEILRRLADGEVASELAREFGISKTAISVRVSKRAETLKTVANQVVTAKRSMDALSISEQMIVTKLSDKLLAISGHLAGAAEFAASTAHRLSGIANAKMSLIDDAKPLDDQSRNELKDILILTATANKAAYIPLNLLAANKEAMREKDDNNTIVHEDRPSAACPE